MPPSISTSVAVHPLVLLSLIDHYNRVCNDTSKRAVGILLGQTVKVKVSCTNSFAVPFEEDTKDSSVWFLDHNYLENMMSMFRKANAQERIVGWYSTGPKIHTGDLDLNELVRTYCTHPVLVIVDIKPKDLGLPTEAYLSVEEARKDGAVSRTFQHLPSEINAATYVAYAFRNTNLVRYSAPAIRQTHLARHRNCETRSLSDNCLTNYLTHSSSASPSPKSCHPNLVRHHAPGTLVCRSCFYCTCRLCV